MVFPLLLAPPPPPETGGWGIGVGGNGLGVRGTGAGMALNVYKWVLVQKRLKTTAQEDRCTCFRDALGQSSAMREKSAGCSSD